MKKILLVALTLCTLCAGQVSAFNDDVEEGFSQKAYVGMTIANLRNFNTDPKVGYSLGWLGEYVLPGAAGTYLNFGLDLSMQGAKASENHSDKLRTHYLTVPLHVGYRYNFSDKWGAYADFGPYFAFGMGGKWSEGDYKWFKNNQWDANRFDCGLGFRVGGEFNKKLSLTVGMNWGLTKTIDTHITAAGIPYSDVKTFCSTITLGYRF